MKHRIAIRLLAWAMLTALLALSLYSGYYSMAAIAAAAWAYGLWLLCRHYGRNAHKVEFLFDAVSNADYSFKFRTEGLPDDDRGINESLNRISQILLQARNEAMEREKYYELIINQANTGIIVVDDKGNIYQSNNEAHRLLGMEVLTHTKQLQRIDETLQKRVQGIRPGEKTQATIQNERGNVDLSLRASAATLKGVKVRIVAINDINSELDDNQIDSWIKLIRVLTHEIMNSVTPITSLSETLMRRIETEDGMPAKEIREGLEVINKTSAQLTAFVDNYRKFTHVPTPVPSLFYAAGFCERMRGVATALAAGKEVDIQTEVEPRDLLVYADENLVAHVATNILKNAVQAIGDKGTIRLHAYANEDETIAIDITNNGPLIPADVAQHIFVPFFTTKKDGSGIGLSISKQIMRLNGGTLTLLTDAKQGLTTFRLTFL